jgi:hypothetical protein
MARLRAIVKAIYNVSIINCCNSPGNFAAYVVSLRRRVIVSCCGTHPSQSKLNSARHRRLGLSAIGPSLKDHYDPVALAVLVIGMSMIELLALLM